jgi:DNA-binding LacI/PurR family transcriptional regulator
MTIKQIAEKAGVSVASVSNVINGDYANAFNRTEPKNMAGRFISRI